MPSDEEKVSRIIDRIDDRVTRLEGANFSEGVPNPLISFFETSKSSDSVAVESQPRGNAKWNKSDWNASEWAE